MNRQTVNLAAHFDRTVEEGAADFPVALRPLYHRVNGSLAAVPGRRAVIREDTGEALGVVSSRYTLVPHGKLLSMADEATRHLDVGEVPRGVYVDRNGARLRALYKFTTLAQGVTPDDAVCPCLKIQNTYDGTSRITVHIGAFRFVCTNLAVGGGGAFAGGFMAVHQGEIPIEDVAKQLAGYLGRFGEILGLYRSWRERPLDREALGQILEPLPKRVADSIRQRVEAEKDESVYAAYNAATRCATHEMRSAASAFRVLNHLNRQFQALFPSSAN